MINLPDDPQPNAVVRAEDPGPLSPPAVDAVIRDGVIVPLAPLDLPEGTPLRAYLTLRLDASQAQPLVQQQHSAPQNAPVALAPPMRLAPQTAGMSWVMGLPTRLAQPLGRAGLLAELRWADAALLAFGMLVYAIVRFVGLALFPIYFFCDEAIQTNLAAELLRNGWRSPEGMWFPPYFRNVEKWSLSLTVYIQAISVALFGTSVEVTRGTSAFVSLLAGIAVALALRLVFNTRTWWVGPLFLSALPVWFLHSRTAFETVMMVAFYACFLSSYLIYRCRDPRWGLPAIIFGGATFYSYTNGQGVMLVSGLLLLLSDWPYHIQIVRDYRRLRWALVGALLLTIAPYLRFRIEQPEAMAEHLSVMNSIWLSPAPITEKISVFAGNYLQGISPIYWFSAENGRDLDRHLIKGAGNLPLLFAPFGLIGLWHTIRNWRSAAHRAVLIAIFAAPFAAALVFIHNYRALAMVIPAALLFSLGFEQVALWLKNRRLPMLPAGIVAAILLVAFNINLLRVSLSEGPLWYRDYGLYGMQYGATQVFPTLATQLDSMPGSTAFVSHAWANNPNSFIPFFLDSTHAGRVQMAVVDDFLQRKRDIPANSFFVMTSEEHTRAITSGKLVLDPPLTILPYPDGQPGFYFVRVRYIDTIDAILAAEREARSILVDDSMVLDGQPVVVRHSLTDLGALAELIDDNPETLMRGAEANPLVFEFEFAEPRQVQGIDLEIWRLELELKLIVTPADGGEPQTFTQEYFGNQRNMALSYNLPNGPMRVKKLRIELRDTLAGDVVKIHVPELKLR